MEQIPHPPPTSIIYQKCTKPFTPEPLSFQFVDLFTFCIQCELTVFNSYGQNTKTFRFYSVFFLYRFWLISGILQSFSDYFLSSEGEPIFKTFNNATLLLRTLSTFPSLAYSSFANGAFSSMVAFNAIRLGDRSSVLKDVLKVLKLNGK